MINIAICDGSRYYADELKNYIYAILGDNVFVSVHDNYFSLTTYIVDECKGEVDAVYINTRIGKDDGVKVTSSLKSDYPYIRFAYMSEDIQEVKRIFGSDPFYFLTEPYCREYIEDSLYKLINMINEDNDESLFIKNREKYVRIKLKNIYYVESELRLLHIYTNSGMYTTYMTIESVQEKLNGNFIRCHRSYIVNSSKIMKIEKDNIILYNYKVIPISRSHYKDLTEDFFNKLS